MGAPQQPPRQITLFELIPLLCIGGANGAANGVALFEGGGWQRHLVASTISGAVVVLGYFLLINGGRRIERHWPLADKHIAVAVIFTLIVWPVALIAIAGIGTHIALPIFAQ